MIETTNNSLSFILSHLRNDKANTLSDFDINHIAWNKNTKKLVITYTNGNIDLLDANGNIINIPDLYLKSMTDNKQINHIYISGANVYLSLPFGIIKLDTKEGKILDTYKLGFNVNYSYIEDNCLYAASKEAGLYRGVPRSTAASPPCIPPPYSW